MMTAFLIVPRETKGSCSGDIFSEMTTFHSPARAARRWKPSAVAAGLVGWVVLGLTVVGLVEGSGVLPAGEGDGAGVGLVGCFSVWARAGAARMVAAARTERQREWKLMGMVLCFVGTKKRVR